MCKEMLKKMEGSGGVETQGVADPPPPQKTSKNVKIELTNAVFPMVLLKVHATTPRDSEPIIFNPINFQGLKTDFFPVN
jgi:hypothetical protein